MSAVSHICLGMRADFFYETRASPSRWSAWALMELRAQVWFLLPALGLPLGDESGSWDTLTFQGIRAMKQTAAKHGARKMKASRGVQKAQVGNSKLKGRSMRQ